MNHKYLPHAVILLAYQSFSWTLLYQGHYIFATGLFLAGMLNLQLMLDES